MKTKKLITLALSAAMISAAVVSVSAATLTQDDPDGKTEVIATIKGSVPEGITYEIKIPDVIDFGELTQPTTNTDSYKTVNYTLRLNKLTGENFIPGTQQISVYVKDQNAKPNGDDVRFYIANKENPDIKFQYDVYDKVVNPEDIGTISNLNAGSMTKTKGFFLCDFYFEGQEMSGTLCINQSQLYGRDILDIAGDYSGYMLFYSTIENS